MPNEDQVIAPETLAALSSAALSVTSCSSRASVDISADVSSDAAEDQGQFQGECRCQHEMEIRKIGQYKDCWGNFFPGGEVPVVPGR